MVGCTTHQKAWFVSCTAIHVGIHPLFDAMLGYDIHGYMITCCCAFLQALILLSPTRALPIALSSWRFAPTTYVKLCMIGDRDWVRGERGGSAPCLL